MAKELTLSIIKPDAVKRCLTGKINTIFESNKLTIVAQKMILLSKTDAKKFYNIHKDRAFFNESITSFSLIPREIMNFIYFFSFGTTSTL